MFRGLALFGLAALIGCGSPAARPGDAAQPDPDGAVEGDAPADRAPDGPGSERPVTDDVGTADIASDLGPPADVSTPADTAAADAAPDLPAFDAAAPDLAPGPDAAVLPLPTRQEYLTTLYPLGDTLLATQILTAGKDQGALVSPGTNPVSNATYSRAGEAVYPLAVAYKHSQQARYRDGAIRLGNWLVGIQRTSGAWGEDWPGHDGWEGTSADQLISLAGAYAILKPVLAPADEARWASAITRCADWIQATFPMGNINYAPTGAVALVLAHRSVAAPKAGWLTKAAGLVNLVSSNADGLITGEGSGVDPGYNLAQSIGYVAMYGRLLPSPAHVDRAVELLRAHLPFLYPNGAVDNSWGTRSFKWTLESGTKTAPGVYFAFALLADRDPRFQRGAALALELLRRPFLDAQGWVVHGPHAFKHPSASPPSNYGTFARAQSLAMAAELGVESSQSAPMPAEQKDTFAYFPTVKVGVMRTDKIRATVAASAQLGTYPRATTVRGGSLTALWFEGYGPLGFLQLSSVTRYDRIEPMHMPVEGELRPLTPRIETSAGTYHTNLYDDQATLSIKAVAGGFEAVSTGALRNDSGGTAGTTFTWSHQFQAASYAKEAQVSSPAGVQIVEPFVDNPGNQYALDGANRFRISLADGREWQLEVVSSNGAYQLVAGQDRDKYWQPFPGVEAYPLVIRLQGAAGTPQTIRYTVSQSR